METLNNRMDYQAVVELVTKEIAENLLVEVEASGRHVHLSQHDLFQLFGDGYQLTPAKELSQPGQFACKERVTLCGQKNEIKNVVILGPCRSTTQIEISMTDCNILGIKAPIRESGKIENSPGITIKSPKSAVQVNEGLIVAQRHLHITPADAEKFGVADKEIIRLKVFTDRPLIFDDVLVRVSKTASTVVHIDYDEANACDFKPGTRALIIKKQ